MINIISVALIVISIPFIALLIVHAIKRARELSHRIDEYHEEQEAQSKQPGPIDPYQGMAQLFGGEAEPGDREKS